jgi:superfamily II DNA or RNA helicase
MKSIIKRSGLLIPKEYENEDFYIQIKNFLERRFKEYNKSTYLINKFYIESEKFLLIPRNFPIQQYIFDYELEDNTHEGIDINISHLIKPRSIAQKRAIDYILENDNGVLQLSPGVGKTVITIYMIATRKKKSLILVHRDSLAEQWKTRLMDFTDVPFENIARLTSTKFEKDLEKPIIISTVQTFLSLLNRKRAEFLTALHDANIGIFVADEVHTSVGAPTFSECSIHIPCKYTYGLSATPYRFDGNGDIITFHLGDIYSDEDSHGTMKANVSIVLLDYGIDGSKSSRYIRWGGKFQRARYLNLLKKSQPFMDLVQALMDKLKFDRNIILIAERIKLIDELYEKLNFASKSKFYRSESLAELTKYFTFATPGKCRDGIDAPWKDALIITSPISNIDQLSGRVVRTYPEKKTPIIIDMVDYGCKDISRTLNTRLKFYESKQWPIQFMLCKDNQLVKIDKPTAMNILRGE